MEFNKKDFECYFLMHASHADLRLHQKELIFLIKKFGTQAVDKIKIIYDSHSEYQKKKTIKEGGIKYYADAISKQQIAHEIINCYYSDDEFHILEKNQILNLRSIL